MTGYLGLLVQVTLAAELGVSGMQSSMTSATREGRLELASYESQLIKPTCMAKIVKFWLGSADPYTEQRKAA